MCENQSVFKGKNFKINRKIQNINLKNSIVNKRKRKGLWVEIVNGQFCTMTPGGMLLGGSPKLVGGKDPTRYLPESLRLKPNHPPRVICLS